MATKQHPVALLSNCPNMNMRFNIETLLKYDFLGKLRKNGIQLEKPAGLVYVRYYLEHSPIDMDRGKEVFEAIVPFGIAFPGYVKHCVIGFRLRSENIIVELRDSAPRFSEFRMNREILNNALEEQRTGIYGCVVTRAHSEDEHEALRKKVTVVLDDFDANLNSS